eukprot:TRINITY_DN55893_c0_g1_i1.p1 TRINITY_DN55893_c0_g1~~TRINITY_DN55893_c0_g1_i1.p1  ORF type:complete len:650 (-),score=112.60 TRINITY_DN55893_c0_g1_i1:15-1964(-)
MRDRAHLPLLLRFKAFVDFISPAITGIVNDYSPRKSKWKHFEKRKPTLCQLAALYTDCRAKHEELQKELDVSWVQQHVLIVAAKDCEHAHNALVQVERGQMLMQEVTDTAARKAVESLTMLKQMLSSRTKGRATVSVDGGIQELEQMIERRHGEKSSTLMFMLKMLGASVDAPTMARVKDRVASFKQEIIEESDILDRERVETSEVVHELQDTFPLLKKTLLRAAKALPANVVLQHVAFDILNQMLVEGDDLLCQASNPGELDASFFVEAIHLVLVAMQTHAADDWLQTNGCVALGAIAAMSGHSSVKVAAVDGLLQAAEDHQEADDCVHAVACSSLSGLVERRVEAQMIVAFVCRAQKFTSSDKTGAMAGRAIMAIVARASALSSFSFASCQSTSGERDAISPSLREVIAATRWLRMAETILLRSGTPAGKLLPDSDGIPLAFVSVETDVEPISRRCELRNFVGVDFGHTSSGPHDLRVAVLSTSGMRAPEHRFGDVAFSIAAGKSALLQDVYVECSVEDVIACTSAANNTRLSFDGKHCSATFEREFMTLRCFGAEVRLVVCLRVKRQWSVALKGHPLVGKAILRLSMVNLARLRRYQTMSVPLTRNGRCTATLRLHLQATKVSDGDDTVYSSCFDGMSQNPSFSRS